MKIYKRRNKKNCIHRRWFGNLVDGSWKCGLLSNTRCHYSNKYYSIKPCKGVCDFYDEGIKNKHGVVIDALNRVLS